MWGQRDGLGSCVFFIFSLVIFIGFSWLFFVWIGVVVFFLVFMSLFLFIVDGSYRVRMVFLNLGGVWFFFFKIFRIVFFLNKSYSGQLGFV